MEHVQNSHSKNLHKCSDVVIKDPSRHAQGRGKKRIVLRIVIFMSDLVHVLPR